MMAVVVEEDYTRDANGYATLKQCTKPCEAQTCLYLFTCRGNGSERCSQGTLLEHHQNSPALHSPAVRPWVIVTEVSSSTMSSWSVYESFGRDEEALSC